MHKTTDEGWKPIETSISGANHAVLYAQNDRWGLLTHRNFYAGPKGAVLHAKATDEGWDQ